MNNLEKTKNKEYDFFVSLGGNCAAAGQLIQRGLRKQAMPFDNFFLRNEQDIQKFMKAFENDFEDCFLKENLRELLPEERGNSTWYQYQDMVSGYNIIHLFHESINVFGVYEEAKATINRRLKRFYEFCEKANSICFVFTSERDYDNELAISILEMLKKRFSNKVIHLLCIFFDSTNDDYISEELEIHRIHRKANEYDYYRSNIEWLFMEDYKLSVKEIKQKKEYKLIDIHRIKRGLSLSILPFLFSVIMLKLYLFGLSFNFSIGRFRKDK